MPTGASQIALITGATGFIGAHLARRALAAGWQVRLLVRDTQRLAPDLRVTEVLAGDLRDADSLAGAVKGVNVVFHCAGNVATWDTWQAYHQANVEGVQNLLTALSAVAPHARLVHFSSVDVYGFPQQAASETMPLQPIAFGYGESKRQGEALVQQWCNQHGQPYCVLRPCNVFGAGSPFVRRIGAELTNGLMLTIDGGQVNAGWVDVDNLADYALWAALAPEAVGRCYNVRDAVDVTWRQILRDLKIAIQGRGLIINLPFGLANALAFALETMYRVFAPGREPLLHRLVVRLFGRTCGHSAAQIHQDAHLAGQVDYALSMQRSAAWFLAQKHGNAT